jgi:hypothetical protein
MKTKTDLHAGACPGVWNLGTVQESSGGGYYGTILGDDGTSRYFNLSYTEFCPANRGIFPGERVLYAPITEPGDRQGKVGCVTPMTCTSASG